MCSAKTVRSSLQPVSCSTILPPGTERSVVSLTPRGAAFGGGQFEWNWIWMGAVRLRWLLVSHPSGIALRVCRLRLSHGFESSQVGHFGR